MLFYLCKYGKTLDAAELQLCKVVLENQSVTRNIDTLIGMFALLCFLAFFIELVKITLSFKERDSKFLNILSKLYSKAMPLLIIYSGFAAIFGVFSYLILFYKNFVGFNITNSAERWGLAGDFFGGILNPILAFCSFVALLYTIKIQTDELKMTREELRKSACAAEKSAELEESNIEQQKSNIERQFDIARYQQLMVLAREKLLKINREVFENYMHLKDDGSGGENPLREEPVQSIKSWFEWVLKSARYIQRDDGSDRLMLSSVQSMVAKQWSGYEFREEKLISIRRDLTLLGFIMRDLASISPAEVNHIRSDVQFAVGILFCVQLITYRDPILSEINSETGCPFQGFLDANQIMLSE